MPTVYSLVRKIHLVALRKEKGLAQADVARALSVSRSTVTRLEKRLLTGRDVPISSVERYEAAVGACAARERKAVKKDFGFYESAEEALASVVHSSLCEGLVTPPEDIENLLKVARGEITTEELIRHYIEEALAKKATDETDGRCGGGRKD